MSDQQGPASTPAQTETNAKEYGLTHSESDLLRFIQQHQQAIFASVLSTIARDRLSYSVTERTQFNLTADFKRVQIGELPENSEGSAGVPAQPPTEPKPDQVAKKAESPVKTAG